MRRLPYCRRLHNTPQHIVRSPAHGGDRRPPATAPSDTAPSTHAGDPTFIRLYRWAASRNHGRGDAGQERRRHHRGNRRRTGDGWSGGMTRWCRQDCSAGTAVPERRPVSVVARCARRQLHHIVDLQWRRRRRASVQLPGGAAAVFQTCEVETSLVGHSRGDCQRGGWGAATTALQLAPQHATIHHPVAGTQRGPPLAGCRFPR